MIMKLCYLSVLCSLALLTYSLPKAKGLKATFQVEQGDILISYSGESQKDSSNPISNIQAELLYGRDMAALRNEIIALFVRAKQPVKYKPMQDILLKFFFDVGSAINRYSGRVNAVVDHVNALFEVYPIVDPIFDDENGGNIKLAFEELLDFNLVFNDLQEIRNHTAVCELGLLSLASNEEADHQRCLALGHTYAQEELLSTIQKVQYYDRLITVKGMNSLITEFIRKAQNLIDTDVVSTNQMEEQFKAECLYMFFNYKEVILPAVDKVEKYKSSNAFNPKFLASYLDELNYYQTHYHFALKSEQAVILRNANAVYKEIQEIFTMLKKIWVNFEEVEIYNTEFHKVLQGIFKDYYGQ